MLSHSHSHALTVILTHFLTCFCTLTWAPRSHTHFLLECTFLGNPAQQDQHPFSAPVCPPLSSPTQASVHLLERGEATCDQEHFRETHGGKERGCLGKASLTSPSSDLTLLSLSCCSGPAHLLIPYASLFPASPCLVPEPSQVSPPWRAILPQCSPFPPYHVILPSRSSL